MTTSVETSTTDPTRIVVKAPFVMNEHIKAIPGWKWSNTAREWTVPLSWTATLALREEFPSLEIGPNLLDWAKRVGPNKRWLRSRRLTTDLNPDDGALNALVGGDEFKWLFPHQRSDALSIFMAGGSFLLMSEMGVGKTASALAGLRLLEIASGEGSTPDPFPILVVAPKSMLRTWEREIRKSFPDAWKAEHRSISIVDGTPAKVRKALEPGHDIYIVGWELLRRYSRLAPYGSTPTPEGANVEKELNALQFSTIIGDECHRVTDGSTQRSRAFKYLCHRARYRIGLTGSPIGEGAVDLWHLLHTIAPHEYPAKGAYVARWLSEEWGEWGERIIGGLRPDREDEFRANFETLTRRMTTDILPGLPPVVESIRWVTLPPKHRKAYESMKNNLIAEIEGGVLTAQNMLVRTGRLVQLANSLGELTVEEDGTSTYTMTDESPKLDAFVADIVDGDFDGHSVVVFSSSKQLLKFLAERLEKINKKYVMVTGDVTGADRQVAVDLFQSGGAQFCLITQAGGEGITLTRADTMVRLVRHWSYRIDTQVAARIRRIGSESHARINYIDYAVEDSIEQNILLALHQKQEAAELVLQDQRFILSLLEGVNDEPLP